MYYNNNPLRKDLLGCLKIFLYIKQQVALARVLKPFKNYPLIKARTRFIYLFSYLSHALKTKDKLAILIYHYHFLLQVFAAADIANLFGHGIECWTESIDDEKISIRMVYSAYLEFEGSLSLLFYLHETCIYTLSFTIAPGKYFGLTDKKIIFISRLQGTFGEIASITRTTKNLNDLIPPTILMSVMEGIGLLCGIKKIIGISAKDQLSADEIITSNHYDNYDNYWRSQGGTLMDNGNYLFPCPLQSKPIELIKSKYRGRTIGKRAKRREISAKSFDTLSYFIKKEDEIKIIHGSFGSSNPNNTDVHKESPQLS